KNPAALGWLGFDIQKFAPAVNELAGTTLTIQSQTFPFKLGGFLDGTGNFGIAGEKVTFDASATVNGPHLAAAELKFSRGEKGELHAAVDVPLDWPSVSGSLHLAYDAGTVTGDGDVSYTSEKFSGRLHVMLTDPETARNIAQLHLPPEAFRKPAAGGAAGAG